MSTILQQILIGLTNGMVFALVASFLALTLIGVLGMQAWSGPVLVVGLVGIIVVCSAFAAGMNVALDRAVYKPLRNAPKLAPLVSAIGVSFIFQNLGLFWGALPLKVFAGGTAAAAPKAFPDLISNRNLLGDSTLRVTPKDLVVILSSLAVMAGLYLLVRHTRLGKAMRATAEDPVAARLMGIDVDRVIAWTFAIGGALAGFGAVIYGLYINTISYQIGYQNGLYAFTAAVLGGIGNITGAVVGGLVIGLVRAFSDHFIGAQWQAAVLVAILILLLVVKPSGLLGVQVREKV
jgi:branched-chain amino acid transport system permease protein